MKDLWQSYDYSGNCCFPNDGIILWQFRENDEVKGREFTGYGFGFRSAKCFGFVEADFTGQPSMLCYPPMASPGLRYARSSGILLSQNSFITFATAAV